MEPIEIIKIAISALKVNKARSVLTMLGVIIGVTSVILLVSIGAGLKTYITSQLESLGADALFVMPGELQIGTGSQRSTGPMGAGMMNSKFTETHLKAIQREAKDVKNAMAYIENNGTMKYKGKTHTTQVVGVGTAYPEMRGQAVAEGSFFTESQYQAAKKVVVLGKTVAEELFGSEEPVGKKITLSDQRYTVLGVLEPKGAFGGTDLDNQAFIPATTAMQQFDMEYIMSFWIQAKNSEVINDAKTEVENILGKTLKKDEFSVVDTKSILSVISSILGTLTVALGGIAAISLLVGGIGIMNIMLVSVTERTREIGLRKAIGATPKTILSQFLTEAIILSFLGGTAGIILGVSGSLIINRFFTTTITSWSIILAFSVSALIGVIFGVTPAAKAARLNPIDALRYE
jgi:putative ABC transport system permease protein